MIVSVDPGLRHLGVACWDEAGRLLYADLVKNTDQEFRGVLAWRAMEQQFWLRVPASKSDFVIVECPRIYPHSDQRKGDLNDLLEVAGVVGILVAKFATARQVYPADWKGQVEKKVMNQRAWGELTADEKLKVKNAADHNVLDGIGIGLFHFGRLGKKKVFR